MTTRLAQVVRKRHALVARCAAQRDLLGVRMAALQPIVRIGSTAMEVGRALRQHPAVTGVAALTLLGGLAHRHRLLVWAGRAFALWELYRMFRKQRVQGHSR